MSTYLQHNIIHSYTLECNYNCSKSGNEVPPVDAPGGDTRGHSSNQQNASLFTTYPDKFTPSIWGSVGRACVVAMMDIRGFNPASRIPKSKHKTLSRYRSAVLQEVRQRKEYKQQRGHPGTSASASGGINAVVDSEWRPRIPTEDEPNSILTIKEKFPITNKPLTESEMAYKKLVGVPNPNKKSTSNLATVAAANDGGSNNTDSVANKASRPLVGRPQRTFQRGTTGIRNSKTAGDSQTQTANVGIVNTNGNGNGNVSMGRRPLGTVLRTSSAASATTNAGNLNSEVNVHSHSHSDMISTNDVNGNNNNSRRKNNIPLGASARYPTPITQPTQVEMEMGTIALGGTKLSTITNTNSNSIIKGKIKMKPLPATATATANSNTNTNNDNDIITKSGSGSDSNMNMQPQPVQTSHPSSFFSSGGGPNSANYTPTTIFPIDSDSVNDNGNGSGVPGRYSNGNANAKNRGVRTVNMQTQQNIHMQHHMEHIVRPRPEGGGGGGDHFHVGLGIGMEQLQLNCGGNGNGNGNDNSFQVLNDLVNNSGDGDGDGGGNNSPSKSLTYSQSHSHSHSPGMPRSSSSFPLQSSRIELSSKIQLRSPSQGSLSSMNKNSPEQNGAVVGTGVGAGHIHAISNINNKLLAPGKSPTGTGAGSGSGSGNNNKSSGSGKNTRVSRLVKLSDMSLSKRGNLPNSVSRLDGTHTNRATASNIPKASIASDSGSGSHSGSHSGSGYNIGTNGVLSKGRATKVSPRSGQLSPVRTVKAVNHNAGRSTLV